MGKLRTILRRFPKRLSAMTAMIAAAVVVPAVLLAWGPDRPTYTIAHPADHVTFDSITDNPNIGDERNFVGIRKTGSNDLWTDNMAVQPGQEYTVRVYVHNNAASSLNLVAKDVTAKVNLPTTTGKSIQVDGLISSSNATPKEVWDQATFSNSNNFNLAYVPGSLKYENNFFGANGTSIPESVFTDKGALLGYDKLDGNIPGCFQYAGYLTFTVKPQFAPTSTFNMSKLVSKHGANQWSKSYAAQPGEKVDYLIQYKNTGEAVQNNVMVSDTLPQGMSYVNGSTLIGSAEHPSGATASDNITKGGINIGSYGQNGGAWVIFSATTPSNDNLPTCGANTLVNTAKVETDYGNQQDTANITVNKTCQTPTPKYTCDALTVATIDRTHFKFDTKYTVENATFKSVQYTVRDASGKVISQSADANYTQNQPSNYTVQSTITVTVDGQDKTATSENCTKPFTVSPPNMVQVCNPATGQIITVNESEQGNYKPVGDVACQPTTPTPTTPNTPTELPHTGASDSIIALLGAGSLVAAIGYYIASRRALS